MPTTIAPGSVTTVKPLLGHFYVREMVGSDLGHVATIEKTSQETYWNREDFRSLLDECTQGRVVTFRNKVIGHYIFRLEDESLQLLNLTIHPDFRRQKIGSAVLNYLSQLYLQHERALSFTYHVRDSNLSAHLFLRVNKFRAQSVERAYFVDYDLEDRPHYEDAYHFTYDKNWRTNNE